MLPGTKKKNEGTFGCSQVPKPGMRVHSSKPPFCFLSTEQGLKIIRDVLGRVLNFLFHFRFALRFVI